MNLIMKRVEEFLLSNEEIKSAVIWGGGQVGESIAEIIEQRFPKVKLLGVIDSSIEERKMIGGRWVYPSYFLRDNCVDTIIIASIAFENEIYQTILKIYPNISHKIFRISQTKLVDTLLENLDLEYSDIIDYIFEYPDNSKIWELASKLSENSDSKRIFLECSNFLRVTDA